MPSKDSAIASLVFGLFVWVPWLNWIIAALAAYFGIISLIRIRKHPDKYAGLGFAIAGTVLGVATLFLNTYGVVLAILVARGVFLVPA